MEYVPPAVLTHLGQSNWYVVSLPLGTQGYPFITSVWMLKCCLVKPVHQATKQGSSVYFELKKSLGMRSVAFS